MDIDRTLRELKREADRTFLKEAVFTPEMAERVKARIRRDGERRRRRTRWALTASCAAVVAAGLLYQHIPAPEGQGAPPTDPDKVQPGSLWTIPTLWKPSQLVESEYRGQTLRYYGEKPVRLIADPFVERHRQSVTFLLNNVSVRRVQVVALSADGERVNVGHHDAAGPLYDADAHAVLELSLPRQGIWKLQVLADGKHLGQVFVEVRPAISDKVVGDPALLEPISLYLRTHSDFAWIGDKGCAAVHILGTESKQDGTWVYAWGLVQSAEDGQGSGARPGISTPMAFRLIQQEGRWQVTEHRLPRDGSEYGSSLRDMFPPPYLEALQKIQSDPRQFNQMIEKLEQICEAQGATQHP